MKNILKPGFFDGFNADKALNIPISSGANSPRFEMVSNKEVFMENYDSIAEYDDNLIKIISAKLIVNFWGKNLSLKCINDDALIISGIISSIEFESKGEK